MPVVAYPSIGNLTIAAVLMLRSARRSPIDMLWDIRALYLSLSTSS